GEDNHADQRAPDIHPARPDGGGAEEGANQSRQQIVEPDIGLADAQLRGEHHACEGDKHAGGDENADDIGADGNAVESGGSLIGADGVEMAAERQPLGDDPQRHGYENDIDGRHRDVDEAEPVDVEKTLRQHAHHLAAVRVPERQRVKDGTGAQRRDEAVDLRHLDEEAVDEAHESAAGKDDQGGEWPGEVVVDLQADRQDM